MDNWDDFRIVLALSRCGTMRAAADMLGTTHTTVSRRLVSLEAKRGPIFEKAPTGLNPTMLGAQMITAAEKMERLSLESARLERAVGESLSGKVTLSIPEAVAQYLLLESIFELAGHFPAIELQVNTTSRFVDLDRSEADIVVRGASQPPAHLVGRRVFTTHVTYYAHRDYLAETPRDKMRWIAPPTSGFWPDWRERSPYPDVPIGVVMDDITARHRALVKGLGLGRGACFMADPEPDLVRLSDEPPVPQFDVWLLTHPDLVHTPRIRAVTDFLYGALRRKAGLASGNKQAVSGEN